jgi:hypothetical protein
MLAFFNSGEDVNDKGATLKVAEGEVFGRPITEPTPPAPTAAELATAEVRMGKGGTGAAGEARDQGELRRDREGGCPRSTRSTAPNRMPALRCCRTIPC